MFAWTNVHLCMIFGFLQLTFADLAERFTFDFAESVFDPIFEEQTKF